MGPDFNLFLTNRGLDNGVHLMPATAHCAGTGLGEGRNPACFSRLCWVSPRT